MKGDQTFKVILVVKGESRDEARAYLIARLNAWMIKTLRAEEVELPLLFWNLAEEEVFTDIH